MRPFIFSLSGLLVSLAGGTSATIINVPDDYPTIQQGIDASNDGDTVLVQRGTYVENINFNGHNIVLGSLFLTTGDTTYIAETIIDGNQSGPVVRFYNGEDSTATITGFTVRNGLAPTGGGIDIFESCPTIVDNSICFNSSSSGGGIFCSSSDPSIIGNTVSDNSAFNAGGIGLFLSSPTIIGNTISTNVASGQSLDGSGGGIYCVSNSNPVISGNLITGNTADGPGCGGDGGGIIISSSSPIIYDNIISDNAACRGGGIRSTDNSSPNVSGNTIIANSSHESGGGIGFYGANCTIADNIITYNSAGYGGGGIVCGGQNNLITGNYIGENTANDSGEMDSGGGGIYCACSNATISNNTFFQNSAHHGGAICREFANNSTISENVISQNDAEHGGGIASWQSNEVIRNNIIVQNSSTYGGGIYCSDSNWNLFNNLIYGNMSSNGGGLYCNFHSNIMIVNSIFWADSASSADHEIRIDDNSHSLVIYCDIQGGWEGEGNIDADPLFRDPDNGDFHLMSSACGYPYDSPCIDAGDPDILDSLLDCSWGLGEIRSDMGAYGGGDSATVAIGHEKIPVPDRFSVAQNYPNPFNASTLIRYALAEPADVRIEVYDILGRRVETLLEEKQQAGYHQVIWNAGGHPSGMYFYRIQAGDYTESRKMLLLK